MKTPVNLELLSPFLTLHPDLVHLASSFREEYKHAQIATCAFIVGTPDELLRKDGDVVASYKAAFNGSKGLERSNKIRDGFEALFIDSQEFGGKSSFLHLYHTFGGQSVLRAELNWFGNDQEKDAAVMLDNRRPDALALRGYPLKFMEVGGTIEQVQGVPEGYIPIHYGHARIPVRNIEDALSIVSSASQASGLNLSSPRFEDNILCQTVTKSSCLGERKATDDLYRVVRFIESSRPVLDLTLEGRGFFSEVGMVLAASIYSQKR
ncbi:MAG: hypothetical protein ABIJ34_01805 [archaeon]